MSAEGADGRGLEGVTRLPLRPCNFRDDPRAPSPVGRCLDNYSVFIAILRWALPELAIASTKLMKAFVLKLCRLVRYLPFRYLRLRHASPGSRHGDGPHVGTVARIFGSGW